MSRQLPILRTLGRLEYRLGFLIVPVLSVICALHYDMFGRGWDILLLISIAETVNGWIGMLLSVLGLSPAPAPKSVSIWEKLWHRASKLFVNTPVEPVRNPSATWVLKSMKKVGIPHAAMVVDFVSAHFFQIFQMLVWLVMIMIIIYVFRRQRKIMAKLRFIPEVLDRIRLLEASAAALIQQEERDAVHVAPVTINVEKQPAQACDLDLVCVATPFVPGYGVDGADGPPPASEPRFADMLHRLMILEGEIRWLGTVARSRQDGRSSVPAAE